VPMITCTKQYFSSPKTARNIFIFRKRFNLSKNGIKMFDHIFPDKLTLKFLGDYSLTPCIQAVPKGPHSLKDASSRSVMEC
jgi:hypothetical protein